jgi:hypothetical protein
MEVQLLESQFIIDLCAPTVLKATQIHQSTPPVNVGCITNYSNPEI